MERLKLPLQKIAWISLYFVIVSFIVTLLIYFYLGKNVGLDNISQVDPHYHVGIELITAFVFSILSGIIFGGLEAFYFSKRFRRRSYTFIIGIKAILYLILVLFMVVGASLFYNTILLDLPFYKMEVLKHVKAFVSSSGGLYILLMVTSMVIGMIFLVQIDEKMGQGVMWQLFTGKYHQPKEQTRIFMFLDMKSSTTIAEKIGHAKFYDLLNHFFADMTEPILANKGEIYQYVGDEVVISWNMKNGIGHAHCIKCFFDIQKSILGNKSNYEKKFGLMPEFKAGMHFGKVTTGEVGVIKKVITHSGDVLKHCCKDSKHVQ